VVLIPHLERETLGMDIEYGAEVIDRNGKPLGTIDYVIRNTWTGDISKFRINNNTLGNELMFAPEEIIDTSKYFIKVDYSSDRASES
jgi:sporulation protein YlmC with PRC-barrel domain